jgi:hypothetical protein
MMIQKTANRDPIVDEIHQTRQRIAEKFSFSVAAILEDARARQAASGRAVWRITSSNAASSGAEDRPAR